MLHQLYLIDIIHIEADHNEVKSIQGRNRKENVILLLSSLKPDPWVFKIASVLHLMIMGYEHPSLEAADTDLQCVCWTTCAGGKTADQYTYGVRIRRKKTATNKMAATIWKLAPDWVIHHPEFTIMSQVPNKGRNTETKTNKMDAAINM